MRERLAMLISGGGTTMQEIIKACRSGEVPMDVACVISSNPDAGGIERARNLDVPEQDIVVVNPNDFRGSDRKIDKDRFGFAILDALHSRDVTVVTQNGWMPLTPEIVIAAFSDKMFNQHPGPVPEFGGRGMHGKAVHAAVLYFNQRARMYEDWWTEAIAQRVDKECDQGAVVKSERVAIFPDDTVDALQQRVLPVEHRLQIALLKDVASGTVREEVRRILVQPGEEMILDHAKKAAIKQYPKG